MFFQAVRRTIAAVLKDSVPNLFNVPDVLAEVVAEQDGAAPSQDV